MLELVKQVEEIYLRAASIDEDLWGGSVLDLMADQLPDISLDKLKEAIIASDIIQIANYRIVSQIVRYSAQLNSYLYSVYDSKFANGYY